MRANESNMCEVRLSSGAGKTHGNSFIEFYHL